MLSKCSKLWQPWRNIVVWLSARSHYVQTRVQGKVAMDILRTWPPTAFSPRENASRIPACAGGVCKGKNLFTLYICMPKVSRRTERVHVVVEQVSVRSGAEGWVDPEHWKRSFVSVTARGEQRIVVHCCWRACSRVRVEGWRGIPTIAQEIQEPERPMHGPRPWKINLGYPK